MLKVIGYAVRICGLKILNWKLMGLAKSFTTTYQAQINAVCEKKVATVNPMLSVRLPVSLDRLSHVAFFSNASGLELMHYKRNPRQQNPLHFS